MSFNNDEPIFVQIAKMIEDEIMVGGIGEEAQIPSTNELAKLYTINPATVLKGINLLVDRAILYKKRGIGMFVQEGAKEKIKGERKEAFKKIALDNLIQEAKKLSISKEELISYIKESEGL